MLGLLVVCNVFVFQRFTDRYITSLAYGIETDLQLGNDIWIESLPHLFVDKLMPTNVFQGIWF